MKISCLVPTAGRISRLNEVVTCFFNQDYNNKELIILNSHPISLFTNLSQIKIYNETNYKNLGEIRKRLLELSTGNLIRYWDDDDLYLSHDLSQGIENIGDFPAFKPKRSWFWYKDKNLELVENTFESSVLFKKEFLLQSNFKLSSGDEYEFILKDLDKKLKISELNEKSSYIYRWGTGIWHISGSLNNGTTKERTETWIKNNQDIGDQEVKLVDMLHIWNEFTKLTGINV